MSKFNAQSTALEVIEGHDLSKYEIIVTGGASGIGVETCRALAKAGARVVIGARDLKKAEEIAKEIRKDTNNSKVEVEKLELDSLSSVNDFVKRYLDKKRPLNILINNAGIMACPLAYTVDGFESQFGTNHMGHFALTLGLIPALKEGAKAIGKKSRVINVSSTAHFRSDVNFDDINFKKRAYDQWLSYGQSKTANILFSVELTRLYSNEGIISNALMPGVIPTGLQKHIPQEEKLSKGWVDENGNPTSLFNKTVEQGASTTIWASVAPELDNCGGLFLEDCAISSRHAEYALNKENATKLWTVSKNWLINPPK